MCDYLSKWFKNPGFGLALTVLLTTVACGGTTSPPVELLDNSGEKLVSGFTHSCAVVQTLVEEVTTSEVVCWGSNTSGESTVPAGLVNPTAVYAGQANTCTIDGSDVICWGLAGFGVVENEPTGLTNPLQVAVSSGQACVLDNRAAGKVVECWGLLGVNPTGLINPLSIASQTGVTCAIDEVTPAIDPDPAVNEINCWGSTPVNLPSDINDENPTQVALGINHHCAVVSDGNLRCWNGSGDLTGDLAVPGDLVVAPQKVTKVAIGNFHICALVEDETANPIARSVRCWGSTASGQDDWMTDMPASFENPVNVSAGSQFSCVWDIYADNQDNSGVGCWGISNNNVLNVPVPPGPVTP